MRAELAQANANAERQQEFVEFTNVASAKTRAAVRNEMLQASRDAATRPGL
ncbi:MAG TPA: hypothetical protein VJ652_11615 [Noviherbaspirillum sp.]|nr:hypothetical protein [Noviherbaspirillum sp.]